MAVALVGATVLLLLVEPAEALPPGRVWTPTTDLAYPRLLDFRTARLDTDSDGGPLLISSAHWDTTSIHEWMVFAWGDNGWTPRVFSQIPASGGPDPVISLTALHYLVWINRAGPNGSPLPLVFAGIYPQPSVPETTMITFNQSSEYGGAVSPRRRWAVRSQKASLLTSNNIIRTVYSDTVGIWRELPQLGLDEFMCTIAPLSDTAAMAVYSTGTGVRWSLAEGNRWTQSGVIDPRGGLHPRLRLRPSGGLWLAYTDRRQVQIATYQNGAWAVVDSIHCVHSPGETFVAAWCEVSQDGAERPVVTWGDLGSGSTNRDVGCVALPTTTGWSAGEEIPQSENIFTSPTVTRDRNGDAWLAWRLLRNEVVRFAHTYVSATTSTPVVTGTGPQRSLSWALSEPAPESWWAVLRARGRGAFEEVPRLQATEGLEMSWNDASPPAGVLRYRIRRESVDARYRWESEEAVWPPKSARPLMLTQASQSGLDSGGLELVGAEAGAVEVRVYDLQGRVVLRQSANASGSGRDTMRLDLRSGGEPLRMGIYFASVRDATGRTSDPVRLVVLR